MPLLSFIYRGVPYGIGKAADTITTDLPHLFYFILSVANLVRQQSTTFFHVYSNKLGYAGHAVISH